MTLPLARGNGNPLPPPITIRANIYCQVAARSDGKPFSKSTKAVVEMRVAEVYGLLSQAYSRQQVIQYCKENWDINEAQGDTYIAKARALLEKDCQLSRQEFLAECLMRLRKYEMAAAKRGQMQVAVNSARLQAELIGLT